MRIGIFDYKVVPTNPVGSCHLRLIESLCDEHEFVVFSMEFHNPCPDRVRWVRVRAPARPLALTFVAYHVLSPLYYAAFKLKHRKAFDVLQSIESNSLLCSIAYVHFCHKAFLRSHWRLVRSKGLRNNLRWLDHRLHALLEPTVYRHAQSIVVPSKGLMDELASEYPATRTKTHTIVNAVDVDAVQRPSGFDRGSSRKELGYDSADTVLVFAALGHFERKGLPLAMEALRRIRDPGVKLLVVGGEPEVVAAYRTRATASEIADRVLFMGMRKDVRPYLWSADAFVFPSLYEAFPLVTLEAAAAGLPLLAPYINGVEDYLADGVNGFVIEQTTQGVVEGIERFLNLTPDERRQMGEMAAESVSVFTPARFVRAWRSFYEVVAAARETEP